MPEEEASPAADKLYSLQYDDSVDLDSKDKAILEELQKNARLPVTEIARSTGLSRDVVRYRLNKLEENNVIRFYHAMPKPDCLGHPLITLGLIQTRHTGKDKEEKLHRTLQENDNIQYVAELSGDWDIAFIILGQNLKHIEEAFQSLRKQHPDVIHDLNKSTIKQEHQLGNIADLI